LIRLAPVARFWAPAGSLAYSCETCHAPAETQAGAAHAHDPGIVKCMLCARGCVIAEGERGMCRARMNVKGELRSLVYGRPITIHVDPIEKKPFYHFLPGSEAYSLATSGCPLRCKFCQNWTISQARPEDYSGARYSPAEIAQDSRDRRAPVIAFTYNEPTVQTEFLTDTARKARPMGLKSVIVSCGYMAEAPLSEMCQVLDGIKIDLKGYSEEFYKNVSSADLKAVLRSIRQVHKAGVHLEIVNLVVPTLNDSDVMLKGLARFVTGELGPDVPVHFTRFHPDYQLMNLPDTPVSTLERARAIAMDHGMRYAYVGNVPGHDGNNTYCPGCHKLVIGRTGMFVTENRIRDGRCPDCQFKIAGVWA
jgi:pyruvate formate lyase activating enzyme